VYCLILRPERILVTGDKQHVLLSKLIEYAARYNS
jgi:hypothetical protein